MSRDRETVLIATGITGGHFFPAISFAEAFKKSYPGFEIWFVLGKKNAPFNLKPYREEFQFEFISVEPLPKLFSWRLFPFCIGYIKSLFKTARLLAKLKPSAMVSFGSYSTFPSVFLAWFFRIPIIIHEQNRVFGWANQVSAYFAKWITTSFPETKGRVPRSKIQYVGFPIRQSMRLQNAVLQDNARSGLRRILILGGSQGSHVLNEMIFSFFSQLSTEEKERIAVIHITGEKDFNSVSERYANANIAHEVYSFVREMGPCYRRAHVVIARAGAGTIFELAVFGLPAILVPYPFAYAHQFHNAACVMESGGGLLITENDLKIFNIKRTIFDLLFNEERRKTMEEQIRRFDVPDAAEKLVHVVGKILISHKNQ